jgi:hypothetical protein
MYCSANVCLERRAAPSILSHHRNILWTRQRIRIKSTIWVLSLSFRERFSAEVDREASWIKLRKSPTARTGEFDRDRDETEADVGRSQMIGALPYLLPIVPVLARVRTLPSLVVRAIVIDHSFRYPQHTVCDTPMLDRASYRSHNALNSLRYDCQSWLALGDGSFGDSD